MPKVVKKCILCKMTLDDPVKLGEFKTYRNISAHYYCLLLTTQLLQNGADHQGILGFLPEDIRAEEQRVSKQICFYCSKPSANLACCAPKCHRVFHLYCGLENFAICHFKDDFRTICSKHHSAERKKCTKNDDCVICCESMGPYHRALSILAPCCRSGWFHKWCIAKFALNAGYFFKCPLCNNRDVFRSKLVHKGIFVPDQDATWELEPNAFADLLVRPDSCSAENCKCPRSRTYRNYPYTLVMCNTCGSNAIHQPCMEKSSDTYNCSACTGIMSTSLAESTVDDDASNIQRTDESKNNNTSDDEEIDVVTVDKSSKWGNEEPDDDDSVDSLLITYVRRKESTEKGDVRSIGESDMSGDSALSEGKTSRKSNGVNNNTDDISDEDIDIIYRSVKKRKPICRIDSEDSPISAKRSKSGSSLDSVFFDEMNQSFADSDEHFALRITDSPVSDDIQHESSRNELVAKTNQHENRVQARPNALKKEHNSESHTSESFAGFESMSPVVIKEETESTGNVGPPMNTAAKSKGRRLRRKSCLDKSTEFFSTTPKVEDEAEVESTRTLYTVEAGSIVEDSNSPTSQLVSTKESDKVTISSLNQIPWRSRLRCRAKSTCLERPQVSKSERRSLRIRAKSISSSAPISVRRSSRLREKPVEKIYKEDLIYVTELEGEGVKRKAFKEKEILHLFVKSDIQFGQETFDGAFKQNFESNFRKNSRDFISDCEQDLIQSPKANDVILRRKTENSDMLIIRQPTGFHQTRMKRRSISDFDSGNLKHTFFEF